MIFVFVFIAVVFIVSRRKSAVIHQDGGLRTRSFRNKVYGIGHVVAKIPVKRIRLDIMLSEFV